MADQVEGASKRVSLLDYGAGNVRSLRNAIRALGYEIDDITTAAEINAASAIVFPGVGSFGQAMKSLRDKGWTEALRAYLLADRPFFGICLGMQSLFEGSEESPEEVGLGIIPGRVTKFIPSSSSTVRVPQIGWNGLSPCKPSPLVESLQASDTVYFVHSFCAMPSEANRDWALACTDYGEQRYISMVQRGNVCATQFHPEKSGAVGLAILRSFLSRSGAISSGAAGVPSMADLAALPPTRLVKRVIACLDVRSNDQGDLVVTKGDQYDVREAGGAEGRGDVRNLGKPVALCARYYEDGADEVVFLNITSFRQGVLEDTPMLRVLELSSENVFVPLTVGGGIREYTDPSSGQVYSALDVAARYFRAGADKVSIGSDAVYAAEEFLASGVRTGRSCLEVISTHYGAQAVVVSVDPKRVYVSSLEGDEETRARGYTVVELETPGPAGERFCWWSVTVKGGREVRPIDAVQLASACQALGAGEIMLNCIDMDGQGQGYDLQLVAAVMAAVSVPVIASSGAGRVQHFSQVFERTDVMAALAAGIFHRNEVRIQEVKAHLRDQGIPSRITTP